MRLIRSIKKRLFKPPPPPDRIMEAARDLDAWLSAMGTRGAVLRMPCGTLEWKAHPSAVRVTLAKVGQAVGMAT